MACTCTSLNFSKQNDLFCDRRARNIKVKKYEAWRPNLDFYILLSFHSWALYLAGIILIWDPRIRFVGSKVYCAFLCLDGIIAALCAVWIQKGASTLLITRTIPGIVLPSFLGLAENY